MSGYQRPEGGWRFDFQGMRTNSPADALAPKESPYAQNIRSVQDQTVQTRPGYALLFATPPDVLVPCDSVQLFTHDNTAPPGADRGFAVDSTHVYTSYYDVSTGIVIVKWNQSDGVQVDSLQIPLLLSYATGGELAVDGTYLYVTSLDASGFGSGDHVVIRLVRINLATFTITSDVTIIDASPVNVADYAVLGVLVQGTNLYVKGQRAAGAPNFGDGFISQLDAVSFTVTHTRYFTQDPYIGVNSRWTTDGSHVYLYAQVSGSAADRRVEKIDPTDFMGTYDEITFTSTNPSFLGSFVATNTTKIYGIDGGDPQQDLIVATKSPFVLTSQTTLASGAGKRAVGINYRGGYLYITNQINGLIGSLDVTRIALATIGSYTHFTCGGKSPISDMPDNSASPFFVGLKVFFPCASSDTQVVYKG